MRVEFCEVVVGDGAEGEFAVRSGGGAGVDGGSVLGGQDGMGELDALVDAAEVRAGVESCTVAGSGEDGGQGCGGGAFAVGAGDEDGGEAPLRVAECGAEAAHVLEVEAPFRARRQLRDECVEMGDGFGVVHPAILPGWCTGLTVGALAADKESRDDCTGR